MLRAKHCKAAVVGKKLSRALHGYFLVAAALEELLLKHLLPRNVGCSVSLNESLSNEDVSALTHLYDDCLDNSAADVVEDAGTERQAFKTQSRTAKLWLQYLSHIEIIRMFIRSERLSDWSLHGLATSRMLILLNLFATTGHHNHAKCRHLYLQTIQELPETHKWQYEQFSVNGCHIVHGSDRPWTGIWTDLGTEQILMWSLTRGRGLTESVRLTWVYTMHQRHCAIVHNTIVGEGYKGEGDGDRPTWGSVYRPCGDVDVVTSWAEPSSGWIVMVARPIGGGQGTKSSGTRKSGLLNRAEGWR